MVNRIFKYVKGSNWLTHRPPTIQYPKDSNIIKKHIDSETLYNKLNVQMYHYSYVFPDQVFKKIGYYKDSVSKNNCIDNYFNEIYLPWVLGDEKEKKIIEDKFLGVHEFKPQIRGECRTNKFENIHPESIIDNMENLLKIYKEQLLKY